jgi:hypothetical protein
MFGGFGNFFVHLQRVQPDDLINMNEDTTYNTNRTININKVKRTKKMAGILGRSNVLCTLSLSLSLSLSLLLTIAYTQFSCAVIRAIL